MDEVIDSVSSKTITAFLLLMVLVWLFMAVGIQIAGLLRGQLPAPAAAIVDPTGTAADRGRPPLQ